MQISLDESIFYQNGFIVINGTIVYSWIIIAILVAVALIVRLKLTSGKGLPKLQNFFEVVITILEDQIKSIGKGDIKSVFPYAATFFIYIFVANLISLIPGFKSPTASLSTTAALVFMVILVSIFNGIYKKGLLGYLKKYIQPIPMMLPLNMISDVTSSFSLAIRLYGNVMSSAVISAVLSQIVFLSVGFPVLISLLGTISGAIQAYIFTTLAMIFISNGE